MIFNEDWNKCSKLHFPWSPLLTPKGGHFFFRDVKTVSCTWHFPHPSSFQSCRMLAGDRRSWHSLKKQRLQSLNAHAYCRFVKTRVIISFCFEIKWLKPLSLCRGVYIPSFLVGIYGFAGFPDFKWNWTSRLYSPPLLCLLTSTFLPSSTSTCHPNVHLLIHVHNTPCQKFNSPSAHTHTWLCFCAPGYVVTCNLLTLALTVGGFSPRLCEQVCACLHAPPSCCTPV